MLPASILSAGRCLEYQLGSVPTSPARSPEHSPWAHNLVVHGENPSLQQSLAGVEKLSSQVTQRLPVGVMGKQRGVEAQLNLTMHADGEHEDHTHICGWLALANFLLTL